MLGSQTPPSPSDRAPASLPLPASLARLPPRTGAVPTALVPSSLPVAHPGPDRGVFISFHPYRQAVPGGIPDERFSQPSFPFRTLLSFSSAASRTRHRYALNRPLDGTGWRPTLRFSRGSPAEADLLSRNFKNPASCETATLRTRVPQIFLPAWAPRHFSASTLVFADLAPSVASCGSLRSVRPRRAGLLLTSHCRDSGSGSRPTDPRADRRGGMVGGQLS